MGANSGSAITLAGNPQNMLVAHLSGVGYREYLASGGVAGLVGLAVTSVALHLLFRRQLPRTASPVASEPEATSRSTDRAALILPVVCIGLVSIAFFAGANLAWGALVGATLMMLLRRRDTAKLFDSVSWTVLVFFGALFIVVAGLQKSVSWTVLVFFGALFIVVAGLQKTGMPAAAIRAASPYMPESIGARVAYLSAALLAGCQIVSNVPFILLVEPWIRSQPDPRLAWIVTAVVSTLAGNLTLLGSVANIIVIDVTGASEEIGFVSYLKVGLPVTLVSTIAAVAWLLVGAR
jgi:Na+/H+ antiporter NhaD/arsenite permease-like protein